MKHHLTPLDAAQLDSWRTLAVHHQELQDFRMRQTFIDDPERFKRFSFSACRLFLDFSKNLIHQDTINLLVRLTEEARLNGAIRAVFDDETVSAFERRPVLHTALCRPVDSKVLVDDVDVVPEVHHVLYQMTELVGYVHSGLQRGYTKKPIIDMVSIGIDGSSLDPQLVSEALLPFAQKGVRCHYLANIDGSEFHELVSRLNTETTLFIVSSKFFGALETLKNTQATHAWYLVQGSTEEELYRHFITVSSGKEAATALGIHGENVFPMWDWVGGHYSLWSAIDLPIAMSIDISNFKGLLSGAYNMDQHFQTAPFERDIPMLLGLLGVWYDDLWGTDSHTVLPYDYYLQNITDHLRQLDMESNGKGVRQDGTPVTSGTEPAIWGGVGCNGQHAYHQLLYQDAQLIPANFIVPVSGYNPVADHHQRLYANCLSQSQALMFGKSREEAEAELHAKGLPEAEVQRLAPHKVVPGNRPGSTLVVRRISARRLGALIAMYERKVCIQSILQGINAFDQWGVELGKELGKGVCSRLVGNREASARDTSTQSLVDFFHGRHHG